MTRTGSNRQLQRSARVTMGTRKNDRICLKNLETIARDVNANTREIAVTSSALMKTSLAAGQSWILKNSLLTGRVVEAASRIRFAKIVV